MKSFRSGNLTNEQHLEDLHQITEILDKLEVFTFMSTNAACPVIIQPKFTSSAAPKEPSELVDLTKNDGEDGSKTQRHTQDDDDDDGGGKDFQPKRCVKIIRPQNPIAGQSTTATLRQSKQQSKITILQVYYMNTKFSRLSSSFLWRVAKN